MIVPGGNSPESGNEETHVVSLVRSQIQTTVMRICMVVAEWWSHIWARGREGSGALLHVRGPLTAGELTTAHENKTHVTNMADQVENEADGTILE